MSSETLSAAFLDDLWPLILDWNRCATDYTWTKGSTEFYVPKINFDDLAAHEYLARHGYANFMLPERVSCFQKTQTTKVKDSSELTSSTTSLTTSACDHGPFIGAPVMNLCKHNWFGKKVSRPARTLSRIRISCINYLRQQRSLLKDKLSNEYREEQEDSKEDSNFEIEVEENDTLEKSKSSSDNFTWENAVSASKSDSCGHNCICPYPAPCVSESPPAISNFVKDVYAAFLEYDCKCIFLNFGPKFDISEMQRWLQLRNQLQIIVLTTCPTVANQVRLLGNFFYACLIDTQHLPEELSYQKQLEHALNCALKYSREQDILKFYGEVFLFVFAEYRGDCQCNTFCAMKRI